MSDFATFSHARRRFNAPLGDERARALVERLASFSPRTALDLGCGTAELLLLLCERTGCAGTGVDPDAAALAEARRRAEQRGVRELELRREDAREALERREQWDAVLSIGASHALGGFESTLLAARDALRPGGALLLGDGVWHRDPEPEYARFLEESGPFPRLEDRARQLEEAGWELLDAEHATLAEWDAFEEEFLGVARDWADRSEGSPEAAALLEKRVAWNAAYHRHGRGAMGFATFVLRVK